MNKVLFILAIFVVFSCNTSKKVERSYELTQDVDSVIHTELVSKIDSFSYAWSQFITDSLSIIEMEESYITKVTEFDSLGVKRKETETIKNIKNKASTHVAQKAEETRKDSTKVDSAVTTDKKHKSATTVIAKEKEEKKAASAFGRMYFVIPCIVIALILFLLFKLKIIRFL